MEREESMRVLLNTSELKNYFLGKKVFILKIILQVGDFWV
jgi:hypothetical protein